MIRQSVVGKDETRVATTFKNGHSARMDIFQLRGVSQDVSTLN